LTGTSPRTGRSFLKNPSFPEDLDHETFFILRWSVYHIWEDFGAVRTGEFGNSRGSGDASSQKLGAIKTKTPVSGEEGGGLCCHSSGELKPEKEKT
jgi:hypothetical protein